MLTVAITDNATSSSHGDLMISRIALLFVVQVYQQAFKTYLHHHPVSAAISKLNFLQGVRR